MTEEIINDQSPRKHMIGPGSISRSLDLQSDLLLTVLLDPVLLSTSGL